MRYDSTNGGVFERWGPTLFYLSGVLLVGHAVAWGVRFATDLRPPVGGFAALGHLVALLGLLSLSTSLLDRQAVQRGAAAAAVVPAIGWFLLFVHEVVTAAGLLGPRTTSIPALLSVVLIVATVAAYGIVAVAIHRARVDDPTLGFLLPMPAVLLVAGTVATMVTGATAAAGFLTGSGIALSLLAIGYQLRAVVAATSNRRPGPSRPGDPA